VQDIHEHPLFETQLALEAEMRSLGIDRYWKQVQEAKEEGREAATGPAKRLSGFAHVKMVEALEAFFAEARSGRPGPRHEAYNTLKNVDVHLIAHLAIRAILDKLSGKHSLMAVGIDVALMIEDELHYQAFKEQKFYSYKSAVKRAKRSPSDGYKRRHVRASARKTGTVFEDWTQKQRALVGIKLVELFCAATGLAQVTTVADRTGTPKIVEALPETVEWLQEEHKRQAWMSPLYMPTVVPPKPWTSPTEGGYWSGRVRRLTLVKTRNKRYLEGLAQVEMPEVYGAINAIQGTPWQINRRVFETMKTLWDAERSLGIMPEAGKVDPPARPFWLTKDMKSDDMTPEQLEEFKSWKTLTKVAYENNARNTAKRIQFVRMLWAAEKFKDFEAIYFPHQLDFRGRVYPVTQYLHPQGADACRGLLTFRDAVEIGTEAGVKWLASHGAGCWGVDKVSFADRRAWVEKHEAEILASAENPLDNLFWSTAEKPWQALAFCFEWAGFKREGLAYKSQLPVQMDGTCNGLQNFSALLLDPIGAKAVNLLPGDKPSDIYQEVADVVAARVARDAMSDDEELAKVARGWLGHITRKTCKRPVMTLAYGAKRYGFKEQVFVDTVKPWKAEQPDDFPWEGDGWAAAEYMGMCIWDAVGEVVVAARHAMEWLQEAARAVSKTGKPLVWTTPAGFVAVQNYTVPDMLRLKLTFGDAMVKLNLDLDNPDAKLDTRKQATGISPNIVHSLDAAHLMRTVNAAAAKGISAFSLIHDSYGCHAGYANELAMSLREQFIAMYSEQDVLAAIKAEFESAAGEELPALPERGTLDLTKVSDSPYFFS
jgi:DNA-directed RNA polymerase